MHRRLYRFTPSAQPARGFTALELILALGLTGLIALCVLGLMGASGSIWKQQQQSSVGVTSGTRTLAYLERILRASQDVGYWAPGDPSEPATLLLWSHDLLSKVDESKRDHRIQWCELTLVRYDPATKKLKLYRPIEWSQMTLLQQTAASMTLDSSEFNSAAAAAAFAEQSWVESYVLAGGAAGEEVASVWLDVDRSFSNPLVRLRVQVSRGGQAYFVYGTVSLRVRSEEDDWTTQILKWSDS